MFNIMGLNCGPLSDTKVSGYLNMMKTYSICLMIVSVAVDFNDLAIGYLDLQSVITSIDSPDGKDPLRSTTSFSQLF